MTSDVIFILLLNIVAAGSYIIADTKIFGNCIIHFKRFCDNPITVEIPSIFVKAQTRTNIHPTDSISSANETHSIKNEGKISLE
jgi:hypothetical protein